MDRRILLFSRVWAVTALALLAATWKLWTPQSCFPQIPFFELLVNMPSWADWIALTFAGLSLMVSIFLKPPSVEPIVVATDQVQPNRFNWFKVAHLVLVVAIAFLISLDQNRLQPWAYHLAIIGLMLGLAAPAKAALLIRWLAISIYVYSAISKFDYQFVHTVGDQMVSKMLDFVGLETTNWSTETKRVLVLLLPTCELLVGVGLAVDRFRRFATIAAIGLHLSLLIILGPWGLNHRPGVLIWNLFFVFQAIILFWPSVPATDLKPQSNSTVKSEHDPSLQVPAGRNDYLATLFTVLVLTFPLTQWIGICDHWPAWQVYSPSSSRAQLLNDRPVSQWSLDELGVPVYPQGRFQMAVAAALAEKRSVEQDGNQGRFQIELRHQSNRFTGERIDEVLTGPDQFKMKKSRFWLNTRARKNWFD